jgi:alanyl aminopeptidase
VEGNDRALGYYRVAYSPPLLASLVAGDVQKRLSVAERVDFLGNAQSLADTGKLPEASALQLVDTFHIDADPHITKQALAMALAVNEHLVPQRLLPNYQRFLRKNFAARAHELTWAAKPGESDDERLLRPTLLRDIATYGADMQLVRQARQLAEHWLHDHSSVNPNLVSAVMNTAAYYGDRALFDEVLADLKRTHDRLQRRSLIAALSAFREPALIEAAKNALLSGDIPFIEGSSLLFAGQSSDATRAIPLTFLEAHYQQVMDKRPTGGGFDFAAQLPRVGESYCDASSKRKLAAFFEPRVGKVLGGPRVLAQVLENIDVCIASKAAHQPGVQTFLEKY